MSYPNAIVEFRQIMADSAYNKKATKKSLIGAANGVNTEFYTYDKRLCDQTVEVFLTATDGTETKLADSDFDVADLVKGQIILTTPPENNVAVRANYYWTFWIDDEIINFLNKGAEATSDFTNDIPDNSYLAIAPGMRSAAMQIAACYATNSLIQFEMNRRHSEEFLLEQDGNDDDGFSKMIAALQAQSKSYWARGMQLRDDFYTRQGQRNAPSFGIKLGRTRNYGANR